MRATWVPRSRGQLPVGGLVVVAIVGAGCAPSMIRDYAIRKHEVVIAVQRGSTFSLAECKRHEDGTLSDCTMHDVEVE
ncbi:MAG: hypothetical protein KF850_37400 [Labilithrix sp.]|nr:hypothetical protein [Labilithrix sp.]